MDTKQFDRLATAAGLAASLAVGAPMLVWGLAGDPTPTLLPLWVWWACYLVHLGLFLLLGSGRRPFGASEPQLLAGQLVAGAGVYGLAPESGWTAVVLVINAVSAAFVLSTRGALAVVGAQTALIAVMSALSGWEWVGVLLTTGVYGGFQGFAVLTAISERSETAAKQDLAAANAELRAATALLSESSRATERLRIARELHDLVGHQLTALALELEVASRQATEPAATHVQRARSIAKNLLTDVRSAVGDLRAPVPGLETALESIVADLPEPDVHLTVDPDLALDGERTTALVRCVQEIITNAVRHACAKNLWIDVAPDDSGGAVLTAHDDGRGSRSLHMGNGLRGMTERVEQLGGGIRIDTDRKPGFGVTARVPAP